MPSRPSFGVAPGLPDASFRELADGLRNHDPKLLFFTVHGIREGITITLPEGRHSLRHPAANGRAAVPPG